MFDTHPVIIDIELCKLNTALAGNRSNKNTQPTVTFCRPYAIFAKAFYVVCFDLTVLQGLGRTIMEEEFERLAEHLQEQSDVTTWTIGVSLRASRASDDKHMRDGLLWKFLAWSNASWRQMRSLAATTPTCLLAHGL
ncbi:hypothetical protein N7539_007718 [Penicillium diatomitis]|uniref:Uncharacterized protein n=1 Tax=Penicillium diatomitis TaxID=2819901 RepID=A0A9W9WTV5_9EURO|nr:uncharacterized protein N7539_007718 [Penicillium diatomitis]KAJ5475431.1 hypothetical protein N7539_007718 [Penicillium diatomitis]